MFRLVRYCDLRARDIYKYQVHISYRLCNCIFTHHISIHVYIYVHTHLIYGSLRYRSIDKVYDSGRNGMFTA